MVSLSGMVSCWHAHLVRIKRLLRQSEHHQRVANNRRLALDKASRAHPRKRDARRKIQRIAQPVPKRLVIAKRCLQRARQRRILRIRVRPHRVLHVRRIHLRKRLADEVVDVRPRRGGIHHVQVPAAAVATTRRRRSASKAASGQHGVGRR